MKIFLVLLLLESYIRKSNALRLVHCHGKELRTESSQMSLKCDRNSDIAISNTTCQLFCSKSYDPEIRFFKCNRGGWFPVAKPSCIQDSSVTMKTVPAVLGSIFLLFMFSCGFAMYKRKMKRKEERDEDLEAGKRRHHYLKRNPKLAKDLSDVRKKIKAEDSVEVVDEMRSQSIKSLDVPKKRMKKKRMWRLNPRKMKMKFGRFKSRFRQKFRRRSESSEMTSDEESEWEFESSEEDTDDEKDVETEEKIEEDKELAIINKILVENLVFNEKKEEENGEEKEKKREEEEKIWKERRKRKEEDKKRRDLKKDEDEKRERSRRRKKRKLNPYEDYSSSGFNERRYHNFENDYRRQEHHYERGFYQRTTNPIEYFPIKSGKIKPPKKEAKKKVKQDDDVESSQRGGVKYFAIKPRSTDLKREENRGPSKYSPRKLVETKKVNNDIQRVIRERKRHPGRRKEQQKRRKGKYESRSPSRRRKSGRRKDQDRERSHRRHRDVSSKKKRSKRSSNRRS